MQTSAYSFKGQIGKINYEPKSICLYEFIDDYLASFREDNILPCIFYGTEDQGMLADIDMLIADIENECLKYDLRLASKHLTKDSLAPSVGSRLMSGPAPLTCRPPRLFPPW